MAKPPKLKRGFYWRGSTIWVRTDPVDGVPRSTKCTDPEAAYLWEAERQREASNPLLAAARKATIGDEVTNTLEIKANSRAEGTYDMYKVKLGHVIRIFGANSPMSAITAGAVDRFVNQRSAEGASNNTIARELTCLRQMLRYAKRAGRYSEDIKSVMPIDFSANYKPVTRTLAREDLDRLLNALRTDEQRAWVCLAISTGSDYGDVQRARPEHYNRKDGTFFVDGRKNVSRAAHVPILDMFRPLFEYALARLPVSWTGASNGLGRACKRAGIPHLSPKDLRRTASTWLMEAGADQSIVSRFMRHKSDAMVRMVYGQVSPKSVGALLNRQTSKTSHMGPRSYGQCEHVNAESSCFLVVAPERVELSRPFGQGILRPATDKAWDGSLHVLPRKARRWLGSNRPAWTRTGRVRHTETLQLTAAQWALALAAEVAHG